MSTTRSFLGIPVTGDISTAATRVEQRPIEEFAPLVQALLDDETIIDFGWRQYTPYFNDGDPCEFGAHSLWVRTVETQDTDAHREFPDAGYDYFDTWNHPALGSREHRWEYDVVGKPERIDLGYTGPNEARYDRCKALETAIEGGAFDNVLMAAFGDHARIWVKRDGITIEFYEHD